MFRLLCSKFLYLTGTCLYPWVASASVSADQVARLTSAYTDEWCDFHWNGCWREDGIHESICRAIENLVDGICFLQVIGICCCCFFSFLVLCISYAIMSTGQKISCISKICSLLWYWPIGPIMYWDCWSSKKLIRIRCQKWQVVGIVNQNYLIKSWMTSTIAILFTTPSLRFSIPSSSLSLDHTLFVIQRSEFFVSKPYKIFLQN